MEGRVLPQDIAGIELRAGQGDDASEVIAGIGAVYYDGSKRTEYQIKFSDGYTIRERIMPGAFDDVLNADVRGLFNHEPTLLLGRTSAGTMRLTSDAEGLRYEIDPPDTSTGRDVMESIRRGDLSGSSFWFQVAPDGQRWIDTDSESIREITQFSSLFDVGPVTFPAYEATTTGLRDEESVRKEIEARRSAVTSANLARYERIAEARRRGLSL
jgi:HK97 family phage prohead protease